MRQRVHRLFEKVRQLLRADWDPIPGSPEDEYDTYVWGVISRLEKGEGESQIADYLDYVVADLITVGPYRETHLGLARQLLSLKGEIA